jgi:hypothetical protein
MFKICSVEAKARNCLSWDRKALNNRTGAKVCLYMNHFMYNMRVHWLLPSHLLSPNPDLVTLAEGCTQVVGREGQLR